MPSKVENQKLKGESRRSKLWLCAVWLLLLTFNFRLSTGFPQQPQAQAGQPIYPINAKYVQGFGPGYWPTAGSQLTLNLAPGTAVCRNTVQTYTGGTLTLTASTTNYVYLDAANNCTPASNTTGFSSTSIPIARVATEATAITSITDVRTMFVANESGAVTSVGMTGDGVIFNTAVQGSPITTSGMLIPQLLTQTANRILAGPSRVVRPRQRSGRWSGPISPPLRQTRWAESNPLPAGAASLLIRFPPRVCLRAPLRVAGAAEALTGWATGRRLSMQRP